MRLAHALRYKRPYETVMNLKNARTPKEQAAIDQAFEYPFSLQTEPYLFWNGNAYPILNVSTSDVLNTTIRTNGDILTIRDHCSKHSELYDIENCKFHAVLASGSNASPMQLSRKFLGYGTRALVPVFKGHARDIATVYSAHFARGYCSIPATIANVPSSTTELFCALVPDYMLDTLHQSEHIGVNYGYFELGDFEFDTTGGLLPFTLYAYVSLWGSLLLNDQLVRLPQFHSTATWIPAMSEREVMLAVSRLLEPGVDVGDFILQMIKSDDLRISRIQELNRVAAKPLSRTVFKRLI